MSDSVSAGKAAEEAAKERKTICKASRSGKHKWERKGSWPSVWEECKLCGKAIFWK